MFNLSLFKIRMFLYANVADSLGSMDRGGVQLMLIILLQGIWLPLHGYSYESTPFWAGVYMLSMALGFLALGPISGAFSDKYGARELATLGMIVVAIDFFALTTLMTFGIRFLPRFFL
jgi:MFS family permease